MSKRALSLILFTTFTLSSVLVGCGNKQKEEVKVVNSNTSTVTEAFKLPLSDKQSTLKWATTDSYYAPASLNSGLEVWKQIEKKTNVKIQWDVAPGDQYDAAMQIKLSAATNLADIVLVPGGDPTMYGQTGLLIPLEDLIQKYAPNIQKIFKDYPGSKQLHTSADGHIYGLSPITRDSSALSANFVVRKDWLDKLGLKEPTTLDEWVEVLKAFKDKDPNGNGKKDEIPFATRPDWFAEAYGLQLGGGDYANFADVNGKVVYQWSQPAMLDYLTFANKLYKDGLLDPNYGNPSTESTQAKVTKDRVGAYVTYPDWVSAWQKTLQEAGSKNARYIPILPPKGPKGDCSVEISGVIDGTFTGITKDCKDPVLAIKMLDYLWSEDGIKYLAWGIEGKTYTMENGKPKFTDFVNKNSEKLGASDALRSVGAWPTIPWVQQKEQYTQMLSQIPDFENFGELIKPVSKVGYPMLLASKEDQERITALESDINTYRKEMMIKFVIGKEPISKFNKYVETLKSMGLDELISIRQKQYDKYKNQK